MTQINRDQLLERARREVPEVTAHDVKAHLDRRAPVTLVDIREREEFVQGHVPTPPSSRAVTWNCRSSSISPTALRLW